MILEDLIKDIRNKDDSITLFELSAIRGTLIGWANYCNKGIVSKSEFLHAANRYISERDFFLNNSIKDDYAKCYHSDGTITANGFRVRQLERGERNGA